MDKRILVTGASGFTGHYVCDCLRRQGLEVYGLTNNLSVRGRSIDLCDEDAVKQIVNRVKPTDVIHLAAISSADYRDKADLFRVNVEGTRHLLDAIQALENSPSRVLIASSANVYGNAEGKINESMPLNPQNFYAESKARMEEMVRENYPNIPFLLLRPFNYTGVGQSAKFLVPKITNAFKNKQKELELGNLGIARDFSDVRFIAQAYASLINKRYAVDVLNLCSGKEYSLQQILALCQKITKVHLNVKSTPSLKRSSEIWSLHGDTSRMREILGYESPYSFEQTLKWMLSA